MVSRMIPLLMLAGCGWLTDTPSDGAALQAGDTARPDVILVSIDTLRADHLSSYGHSRETSPFIDSLAADGVRFSHARSASPWTLPAHTTMLSGQLPSTHRIVEDNVTLDASIPVLPELMKAQGYATAGVVATLYVSELFGFDRGFDHFEDFGIHTEKANLSGGTTADMVVDDALGWWEQQPAGQPVFLFLHVYDAHYAYDPPEPYASMFDRPPQKGDPKYRNYFHFKKKPLTPEQFEHQLAQYDESIRFVDAQLQRLSEAAAEAGRNVRWVVTADHGEEFGERGSWGHAHTLYSEQLHVPLVVSGPGLPEGAVIDEVVGTHDVAPTIAGWVGAEGLAPDGLDLAEAMGGAKLGARPFPGETTRFKTNRLSLYRDGLRLEWDLSKDRRELFAPGADPAEATDLAMDRPDDVDRLQHELVALLGHPWTAVEAGMVSAKKGYVVANGKRLRSLKVEAGDRFQVLPYDAEVHWRSGERQVGPFGAQGDHPRPEGGAPLSLEEAGAAAEVVLTDDVRAALEAIGYMQEDQVDEGTSP